MRNFKVSNLFFTEFTFKCPKNRFLVNFGRKKVKASLLPEFLSELFEPFNFNHCSESKVLTHLKN